MAKNPQAVLDVLEFYSENLAHNTFEPVMKRSETDPMPLPKRGPDIRPRGSSFIQPSQSVMDMHVILILIRNWNKIYLISNLHRDQFHLNQSHLYKNFRLNQR